MKSDIKKYIVGGIVGACIAVTVFHVWVVWDLINRVNVNTNDIAQIVALIRQAQSGQ